MESKKIQEFLSETMKNSEYLSKKYDETLEREKLISEFGRVVISADRAEYRYYDEYYWCSMGFEYNVTVVCIPMECFEKNMNTEEARKKTEKETRKWRDEFMETNFDDVYNSALKAYNKIFRTNINETNIKRDKIIDCTERLKLLLSLKEDYEYKTFENKYLEMISSFSDELDFLNRLTDSEAALLKGEVDYFLALYTESLGSFFIRKKKIIINNI